MEEIHTTLNHFFSLKNLSKEQLSEIISSDQFLPIKEKMSKELKGIPIPHSFFEQMIEQLSELLHIDVRAILVSVWSKSEEFKKYLDGEEYSPEEILLLPLAEHSITSEHTPALKPFLDKIPLGEIKFHVYLELELKGAVVKIQNGKLMGGTIGTCEGKGSITCGDVHLLEKDTQPWSLPGSIELSDGIPIQGAVSDLNSILSKILETTEAVN